MAILFCWSAIVLLIVCVALQFTARRELGCWLLALFPFALCIGLLFDLAHGSAKIGVSAFSTDLRTLPYPVGFLALTILAALRPNWRWLFWIAWLLGAAICSIAVFLTYFWKVFS